MSAICDFQQCDILTCVDSGGPVQPPNDVRSVAYQSYNIQANSKGSDQTVRMRRLVLAIAGRTYHMVGNPMLRLN